MTRHYERFRPTSTPPFAPRLIPEEEIPGPRGHEHVDPQPTTTSAPETGLRTFAFDHMPVRVVTGGDGEPRWVAKDVAEALGYCWKGVSGTIPHIPEEWRGAYSVQTPSGTQEMAVLTEPGLYFFLARSDKPAALPFQKWIAGEVLPKIRKTGAYSVESTLPKNYLEALKALVTAEESKATLARKVEEQQATISTLAPKADGLDRLTVTTQGTVTLTEAAKLLQQPPRKFTAWLQQIAWVYRSGEHLLPYQDRIHAGMMEHKVVAISEEISVPQAVITPKGLANLSARLGKVPA